MRRLGPGADHGFAVFDGRPGSKRSGTTSGDECAAAGTSTFDFAHEPKYAGNEHDSSECAFDSACATGAKHDDAASDLDDYDHQNHDRGQPGTQYVG